MPMADIWTQDFWGVTELTNAVNYEPYVPGFLGTQGIFNKESVTTTTVSVEYEDGTVYLVPKGVRGGPPNTNISPRRKARVFELSHLKLEDAVKADDVQGVRAFGGTKMQTVKGQVLKKINQLKRHIAATIEYYRVGAINGIVYDSDGSTEILDIFDEFGIARSTQDFDFSSDADSIRNQCMTLKRTILGQTGAWPVSAIGVLCSDTWFDQLIKHSTVTETYKNWQEARDLRTNYAYDMFDYAGCKFYNYRGNVSSVDFVPDDEARAFPMGPDIFGEYYGPADYEETVNTPGKEFYAKSERMEYDRGRKVEVQSNPLTLCHRPSALIKLTMTTA
jgi:hypothetical protein